uniref:Uncharacterized protein n=1 Tax=Leersia perrieri TaxID=77586 RepID=A0A0D9XX07_9ORYZ
MARDRGVVGILPAVVTVLVLLCCFHRPATAMMVADIRNGPPRYPHRLGTVIAVDVGNTNSCVAGYGADGNYFRLCIPTSVVFTDDGDAIVGEAAKNHPAAISGFKRLFGQRFDSPDVRRAAADHRLRYKIVSWGSRTHIEVKTNSGDGEKRSTMYASDVASKVVAELKARAEAIVGGGGEKFRNAVVTVPYYFPDGPREAAMEAARMAGLMTVRIIDEPTSAAISHGLHRNNSNLRDYAKILVLHVGGATSDATVVTLNNNIFGALASYHDLHLGGDDFDDRIVDHFVDLVKHEHGVDLAGDVNLKEECERAKKTLSSHDVAQVNLHCSNGCVDFSFSGSLTRAKFDELNEDLFQKVMSLVGKAMAEAKRVPWFDKIDQVLLIGGSSRIPRIQELVKNYFNGEEMTLSISREPDEAVVHGGGLLSHPMEGGYPCMGAGGRRQIGLPLDRCYHEY